MEQTFRQESQEVWPERVGQIRDGLTDFYFAYNLPHYLFAEIVKSVLQDRKPGKEVILIFNPEQAPWDMLFAKAEEYEAYPPEEKAQVKNRLQEIIVVLIKGMISDQLAFVGIAKNFSTIADLKEIRRRRIGRGKISGKAAGMLPAYKILQRALVEGEIKLEHLSPSPTRTTSAPTSSTSFTNSTNCTTTTTRNIRRARRSKRNIPGRSRLSPAGVFRSM